MGWGEESTPPKKKEKLPESHGWFFQKEGKPNQKRG